MSQITPSFWRDRNVLVTGATGILGGVLSRILNEAEAQVVTVMRDWVPQSELCRSGLIDKLRVVRGDILDQALIERVIGEYEVDTVFHLAAQTIVPIANRNPVSTFESNIRGSWVILEACRRSPTVKQILVASSDKAYGDHDKLPYVEDLELRGRHPYDVSKSCTDMLAQSYASTYDLPVIISRCGNLYGEGDLNWSRVVPGTIRSIIRQQPPTIRSDGRLVRDYFYVEDAAKAMLLGAQRLSEDRGLKGEAFNFSNETPLTVLEIVQLILKLSDSEHLAPIIQNQAKYEIPKQYLDARKARDLLDWQPHYSMEEGISRTISWYRDFFNNQTSREVAVKESND